jgi:hypothetical protein
MFRDIEKPKNVKSKHRHCKYIKKSLNGSLCINCNKIFYSVNSNALFCGKCLSERPEYRRKTWLEWKDKHYKKK